ncbi:hypothetical protein FQA45_00315 [Glutamicibacter halophytocola]|uniref:Phage tail assembly protein n=1 Tax=Glutamicibacter halophytocola TaxID=1933880 RepID=A0ABX5Y433_9MICC|nr:hypothetical protein [Glutamicibacter halophytocola]QDY64878.1 hypothetical protein FQA45_00315 [Glutamicibacter halophytocola]
MKLVVGDNKYPLKEGIAKASLGDLYVLKIKSGMGIKTLMHTFNNLKGAESHLDFLEDENGIQALRAMIFLCRRAAGENIDFEEATNMPLSSIGFETEEQDTPEADPKETPTASAPDDEPHTPEPTTT